MAANTTFTMCDAAATAGVDFGAHVTVVLNGEQITRDGQTPLAAGDTVFFLSADAGGWAMAAGGYFGRRTPKVPGP